MRFLKTLAVVLFVTFLFGAFVEALARLSGGMEQAGPFFGAMALVVMFILTTGYCLFELFLTLYFWVNKD